MSEHTYQHFRTGTFTATVAGSEPPETVEIRWDRHGPIVHLTIPAEAASGVLGTLPATLVPSQSGLGLAGDGMVTLRRGGRTFELSGAVAGGTMHYLSIPGQAEEPEMPAGEPAEEPPVEPPPAEGF